VDALETAIAKALVGDAIEPLKHAIALILDQLRDMELRLRELEEIGKGR